jgi:hypothetical protein
MPGRDGDVRTSQPQRHVTQTSPDELFETDRR